jgi:hypothetical protein
LGEDWLRNELAFAFFCDVDRRIYVGFMPSMQALSIPHLAGNHRFGS